MGRPHAHAPGGRLAPQRCDLRLKLGHTRLQLAAWTCLAAGLAAWLAARLTTRLAAHLATTTNLAAAARLAAATCMTSQDRKRSCMVIHA